MLHSIYNTKPGYHEILPNFGYYIDKIPQNLLNELKEQLDSLQNNFSKRQKANDFLEGEIKHEYFLSPKLNNINYIHNLVNKFETESHYISSYNNNVSNLSLNELWVNYQSKYEYNPAHKHGGLLSFVIWYKIPYLIEEEKEKYGHKTNKDKILHGQFHFIVPKNQYEIKSIPLQTDRNIEGTIAIFPSNLHHTVYPFYSSNEYRITISGNIISK